MAKSHFTVLLAQQPRTQRVCALLRPPQPMPIPVREPTEAELRVKAALLQDARTHIGRLARSL